jgi:hypothetical protein
MKWPRLPGFIGSILSFLFSYSSYERILNGSARISVFLIILVLSILSVIGPSRFIYTKIFPAAKNLGVNLLLFAENSLPENATVTVKNGVASSNLPEPFFISVDKGMLEQILSGELTSRTGSAKIRLLTVDTAGKAEDFERYQSLALLTKNSFVTYSEGKISISPLRNIDDITVSQKDITTAITEFNKNKLISSAIIYLLLVSPLFLLVFAMIAQSVRIFVMSLLVLGIFRILNSRIGFSVVWKYTAYISFLPMVLVLLVTNLVRIPFALVQIAILSFSYFIIRKYQKLLI